MKRSSQRISIVTLCAVVRLWTPSFAFSQSEDVLIQSIRDSDSSQRKAALDELRSSHFRSHSSREKLIAIFRDHTLPSDVRIDSLEMYLELVGPPVQYQSQLSQIAENTSETMRIRSSAIAGIGTITANGHKNEEAVNTLMSFYLDRTQPPEIRCLAAAWVYQLPTPPLGLLQSTLRVLSDDSESTDLRIQLLRTCSVLASRSSESFREMTTTMLQLGANEGESVHLRVQALKSLSDVILSDRVRKILSSEIDLSNEDQRFVESCSNTASKVFLNEKTNERVREQAGWVLRSLGHVDRTLVDDVIRVLGEDKYCLSSNAVHILGEMGDTASNAIPPLIILWKDENSSDDLKVAIKEAVTKIAPSRSSGLFNPEP